MELNEFEGMDNLSGVDRLEIPVNDFYRAAVYHLRPVKRNGKLVLYHNGFGNCATFIDQKPLITSLIGQGYDVLGFNLIGYGGSKFTEADLPRYGRYVVLGWRIFDLFDRPLRFYLDPVVIGLNHVLKTRKYSRIDMVGFSAAAWVTVLASAVESRIQGSYTIAGPYPIYLRSGEERLQAPRPQYYRPMLQAANYPEMFVLATLGEGRRQMHIFNRYDSCCYNNTKGKLYEPAVQKTVEACCAGRFDFVIDETHNRHAISPFALETILRDMARRDSGG